MEGDAGWPHCGVVFISKENEGFGSTGLQAAAEAGAGEVLAAAAVTGAFFCSKMKSSGCCQPALGRAAGGPDGPGCRAFTTKGLGLQLEPAGCPRCWEGATVVAGAARPTEGLVVCFWCWKMEIWHITDQPHAAHVAPRPSCGCRDLHRCQMRALGVLTCKSDGFDLGFDPGRHGLENFRGKFIRGCCIGLNILVSEIQTGERGARREKALPCARDDQA